MELKIGQCWEYTEPNYSSRFIVEEFDKIGNAIVLKCYLVVNKNGYTDDFETGHEYTFLATSLNDKTKWKLRHEPQNQTERKYDMTLN